MNHSRRPRRRKQLTITKIPFYQVDAFAGEVFKGNPAAVCFLDEWLEDSILQSIAAENNLSETAFLIEKPGHYDLRWFTPRVEVDLCGHATLASAHAIFEHSRPNDDELVFGTRSGNLTVRRKGDLLVMDFPAIPTASCELPDGLAEALGKVPSGVLRAQDFLMAVYENEGQVADLKPDFGALKKHAAFGVIVTAPSGKYDFVSRFFAPALGIDEDPVTGSAHCVLAPYWAGRLKRNELRAYQCSERGGEVFCVDEGDRVSIGGRAVTYLTGGIFLDF